MIWFIYKVWRLNTWILSHYASKILIDTLFQNAQKKKEKEKKIILNYYFILSFPLSNSIPLK